MSKSKSRLHLLRVLAGSFVLLLFLISTNPGQVALGLLVVPVLIATFVVYELVRFVFSVFLPRTAIRREQVISLILAISTGLLLMLQSIGQLAAGDLAIIVFFVLISIFYANRFR